MARVGIVIYSLAGAGAERVSVNLAQEFVAAGHAIDFVLAQDKGELLGEVPEAAELHVARAGGAAGWRAAIREYIDEYSPDVLLAMMEGAGVLSIQAAKGRDVRVYVVSHIHFSRHCRDAPRWKERWLMPLAARWYLPRAAGVIGVSQGVTEDIRRAVGLKSEQVKTIYNPILTDSFYVRAAEPLDHSWFVPERDWLTVVTVGRLTAQKDHETLLRAIAQVSEQRAVRLVVLGQGERLEDLEALAYALGIGEVVEFAGFDPNPYRYIAGADVFALSSRWEGLPTVLIEALACRVKIVSTDCPSGPREILNGGVLGKLMPIGDSKAFAKGILGSDEQSHPISKLSKYLEQFESGTVSYQYMRVMGINTQETE